MVRLMVHLARTLKMVRLMVPLARTLLNIVRLLDTARSHSGLSQVSAGHSQVSTGGYNKKFWHSS